jgi:hypothetical protein
MEKFATFLVIAVLCIIGVCFLKNKRGDVTLVESTIDGDSYFVRNLPDKQDAANRLSFIRGKLTELVKLLSNEKPDSLYEQFVKGDKMETQMSVTEFTSCLKQLINKYKDTAETFSESTPDAKYTSYSVNKGEQLVFCLRLKKEGDRLVPKNTILFVALHELSHLMTKTIGHGDDFWRNFRFILKAAIHYGIYTRVDFVSNPEPYCGIKITDTPY